MPPEKGRKTDHSPLMTYITLGIRMHRWGFDIRKDKERVAHVAYKIHRILFEK